MTQCPPLSDSLVARWAAATVRPVSAVPERHTFHAYFNVSPESPDGRFVVFFASRERSGERGDIVVLDRESGEERVAAADIATEDAHRAACQQWALGSRFIVYHEPVGARWRVMAWERDTGAMQSVTGVFVLNGGEAEIADSLVLGTYLGTATNVTARLVVSNGVFTIGRSLATGTVAGDRTAVDYTASVEVAGGVLAVTNAAGNASLSLADGTLALSGGKVYADSLAIGENGGVSVTLSSANSCGTVVLDGGAITLDGSFSAACAEGYEPKGGEVWTIVSGGVRSGAFSTVDIPENMRLLYRPDGVVLSCPAPAVIILFR